MDGRGDGRGSIFCVLFTVLLTMSAGFKEHEQLILQGPVYYEGERSGENELKTCAQVRRYSE